MDERVEVVAKAHYLDGLSAELRDAILANGSLPPAKIYYGEGDPRGACSRAASDGWQLGYRAALDDALRLGLLAALDAYECESLAGNQDWTGPLCEAVDHWKARFEQVETENSKLRERVKELEETLSEALDYVPDYFREKWDLDAPLRTTLADALAGTTRSRTLKHRRGVRMANQTAIEWTDLTWNPVHGCSKVSPGCAHCYAAELSLRRRLTTKPWTPANSADNVILKPHKLREPLSKAKAWQGLGAAAAAGKTEGKLVFVNSMSDLFHEQVSYDFIARVFAVMAAASQHTFQILTKRPERMRAWFAWEGRLINRCGTVRNRFDAAGYAERLGDPMSRLFQWPLPNVWIGVSIENRKWVHRADLLRETPAAVRFISAEPLLGPLMNPGEWGAYDESLGTMEWPDGYIGEELDLTGIDWLIVGGESGPKHRPIKPEWVGDLRDASRRTALCPRCAGTGRTDRAGDSTYSGVACPTCSGDGYLSTAFFFKQWGGARPGGEALLDGRAWREFPRAVGREVHA